MQAYETFPGRILLKYHPYPTQPLAEKIAVGLEAAGEQGKFWDMYKYLIGDESGDIAVLISSASLAGENTDTFTTDFLKTAAKGIGLNMESFNADLASEALLEKVRAEKQAAMDKGITSTEIFINGEQYVNPHGTLQEFYAALNLAQVTLEPGAGN